MNEQIKDKKELFMQEQKEKRLADLFNQCMQLMNANYRKAHCAPIN